MSIADDVSKSIIPAFEIRGADDNDLIQVFANGTVTGLRRSYSVMNRIPLLLMQRKGEGLSDDLDKALQDEIENGPKSIVGEG